MEIVLKEIIKTIKAAYVLLLYFFARLYLHLISKERLERINKTLLISERGDGARDNGFELFKFICENIPSHNAKYIISTRSLDFEKVKKYGNYILYGSVLHYIYYASNCPKVSAHCHGCSPFPGLFFALHKHSRIVKGKQIFINHGITKDDVIFIHRELFDFSLFVCGAKPSYDYVKRVSGYPDGVVRYLGFPRFDKWYDYSIEDFILIIPTWRAYLADVQKSKFVSSKYYRSYMSLINNRDFNTFIEERSIKCVYYVHDEIKRFANLFVSNGDIIVATSDTMDIDECMKKAKLMITDYSGVAFDFAYMGKNVIYYQFDKEEFESKHYKKGYYDYESDGFGPVTYNERDLLNQVLKYYGRSNEYLGRSKRFFVLHDRNNSRRVYDAIVEIMDL